MDSVTSGSTWIGARFAFVVAVRAGAARRGTGRDQGPAAQGASGAPALNSVARGLAARAGLPAQGVEENHGQSHAMILAVPFCQFPVGRHAGRRGLPMRTLASMASMAVLMACTVAHAAEAEVASASKDIPAAKTEWEGAIGLTGAYGPAYPGSDEFGGKLTPGFFLRYGNVTITNASGFITKRADAVSRGLGIDLQPSDKIRLNLALRMDRGRNDDGAGPLAGMGDVDPTLRVRAGGTWYLTDDWRVHAAMNIDALGRGGGNDGEIGFARDGRWSPDTVWTWGGSLRLAVRKYMQSYHGVTPEQAARTGFAVYSPDAGLRDASVYLSLRTDLSEDWILLAGMAASRVLGPVADSPLTQQANGWGFNAGLAWRF
jgi:MipA family protein